MCIWNDKPNFILNEWVWSGHSALICISIVILTHTNGCLLKLTSPIVQWWLSSWVLEFFNEDSCNQAIHDSFSGRLFNMRTKFEHLFQIWTYWPHQTHSSPTVFLYHLLNPQQPTKTKAHFFDIFGDEQNNNKQALLDSICGRAVLNFIANSERLDLIRALLLKAVSFVWLNFFTALLYWLPDNQSRTHLASVSVPISFWLHSAPKGLEVRNKPVYKSVHISEHSSLPLTSDVAEDIISLILLPLTLLYQEIINFSWLFCAFCHESVLLWN